MKSRKHVPSSSAPPLDRLSPLLERFRVRVQHFHSGPLCGVTAFEPLPGRAFLHVLRRGEMEVTHAPQRGLKRRIVLREPALLLYPRPLQHAFHNPPRDGSDFTCATLHFDGGERNPLVAALPSLVWVPLARVEGLVPALELLFAETDHVRCGSRLLADRLFEVVFIQLLRWLIDHPAEAGIQSGLLAGLTDLRLAKVLVAMHRTPQAPWSLQRMATEAGLSRAAFAATFRQVVGRPPAEYLADWRVTLAASSLRAGRPVKQVADEVGYGSAAALSKVFKQRIGAAPRTWLRAQALDGATGLPVPGTPPPRRRAA